MFIRPQQKHQKEFRNYCDSIREGDRITTIGGILGKVRKVKQSTFLIEVANGVIIEVTKNSLSIPSTSKPGDNQTIDEQTQGK